MRTLTTEAGDLLLVEVEDKYVRYRIERNEFEKAPNYRSRTEDILESTFLILFKANYGDFTFVEHIDASVKLPNGNYTILGKITKDGPQFECDKLVPDGDGIYFLDYNKGLRTLNNKEESFISLLNSQVVYLVFPEHLTPKLGDYSYPEDGPSEGMLESIELDMDISYEKLKESTLKEGYKFIALLKTN